MESLDPLRESNSPGSRDQGVPSPFMQLVLGNASETLSVPKKKEAKSIFKRAFILKFGRPRTPESTVALGSLAGPYFAFVADYYPASRAGHVELESGVLSECPFCWRDQDSPSHLVKCTRVMALVSADTDVTDYLECLRDPPVSFNTRFGVFSACKQPQAGKHNFNRK